MIRFDSIHAILFFACIGLAINTALLLADKNEPRWAPNPNAMADACAQNPSLLVCQLPKGDSK